MPEIRWRSMTARAKTTKVRSALVARELFRDEDADMEPSAVPERPAAKLASFCAPAVTTKQRGSVNWAVHARFRIDCDRRRGNV